MNMLAPKARTNLPFESNFWIGEIVELAQEFEEQRSNTTTWNVCALLIRLLLRPNKETEREKATKRLCPRPRPYFPFPATSGSGSKIACGSGTAFAKRLEHVGTICAPNEGYRSSLTQLRSRRSWRACPIIEPYK
jgi:hypothetical protein